MVGDLGFSVVEPFAENFPRQFLNAGVAEQNMAGMAAGLSSEGYHVFIYSIANFPTLRCLEQIRNDICHHSLPVTIVSVGGGLAYGSQGYSHYAIEDLAILRVFPGMTVLAPADPIETKALLMQVLDRKKPTYLRLGKAGEPIIHDNSVKIELGKAAVVCEGKDLTLVSTGGMLKNTLEAAKKLKSKGIDSTVLSMHTLSPFDAESILKYVNITTKIISIEEHGIGGLSSCISEILVSIKKSVEFVPIFIRQKKMYISGDQSYLCKQYGLDPETIINKAYSLFY